MRRQRNRCVKIALTLLALATGLGASGAAANEDDFREAKQRAADRYPTLVKLKQAGKIGEVHTGYVGVVKDEYRDDQARPDQEDSPSVADVVSAENTYRKKVYKRIAEEVGVSAEQVARRKAQENFKQAEPEVFLKLPERPWTRKKNLKD